MTNPDERGSLPGPRTEEGKEVARWNATRHGISSPEPVVPGLENAEDWESHLEGIMDNLSPVGHLEDGRSTERSSVMARERYGNGYKGRAATRRRRKSRGRGYMGSPKTAGRAKGRMAHDWTVGKVWK